MIVELFYDIFKKSSGVSIDSRTIQTDQIFFAISGENFDGHNFLTVLADKGVKYAVIDNKAYYKDHSTILVNDSLKFLQELAQFHRKQFDIPVLAITGSNGKTSTKELLNSVLVSKYKVHATKGNYNNHLGVPLTILSAKDDTDFLIVEMGANHIGEIHELCEIALPNYGIITNIGKAHIEGFGSVEGIIQAKTELYKFLRNNKGTIFYNNKDRILSKQVNSNDNLVPYSSTDIELCDDSMTISFKTNNSPVYRTNMYGEYNLENIAAVLKIAGYFKIDRHDACMAVAEYSPEINRSQIITKGTTTFIMDAYNANPSSMISSIKSLEKMDNNKKKALLLGDMKELGKDEIKYHQEILKLIAESQWNIVGLVGPLFSHADKHKNYLHFDSIQSLMQHPDLTDMLNDSICLIKGSRSMKMEDILGLY